MFVVTAEFGVGEKLIYIIKSDVTIASEYNEL